MLQHTVYGFMAPPTHRDVIRVGARPESQGQAQPIIRAPRSRSVTTEAASPLVSAGGAGALSVAAAAAVAAALAYPGSL